MKGTNSCFCTRAEAPSCTMHRGFHLEVILHKCQMKEKNVRVCVHEEMISLVIKAVVFLVSGSLLTLRGVSHTNPLLNPTPVTDL